MKRGMRAAALLLILALLLGLGGCSLFDTKMARAIQKLSKTDSLHLDVYLRGGVDVKAAEETVTLPVTASGGVDLLLDPVKAAFDVTLEFLGTSQRLRGYLEEKDGAVDLYTNLNGGSAWEKRSFLEKEDGPRVRGLRYFIDGAETFLPSKTEEVLGLTCTRYDGAVSSDFLQGLMELYDVGAKVEDAYGIPWKADLFAGKSDVPARMWLEEDSGRLVRIDMDLSDLGGELADTLLENMRQSTGLSDLDMEVSLSELVLSVAFTGYDVWEDILMPEAISAVWGSAGKQPWES
ncbi:MAG: hypothetical protein J5927_03505 [Oscillospiraceae bacterium]|nr:hypothetical protein [Oscillospiraceae bacterium]